MSRSDGFTVMDVSTDICNDPKFRRLHRYNPEHVAPAFFVYMAVLGESWKAGRRVTVGDSWPVVLPFDPAVVASMVAVGLLDKGGRPPAKAWAGWYEPARERRDVARERWRRANEHRRDKASQSPTSDIDATAEVPRGNNGGTAATVPSVPSVRPSDPDIHDVEPLDDGAPALSLVDPWEETA